MDRTAKIKIALGITLALLLIRTVLHYLFPIPLEFLPYTPNGTEDELYTFTATEVRFLFVNTDEYGKIRYYYEMTSEDGQTAVVTNTVKYYNEIFDTPVTYTGKGYAPKPIPETERELFFASIQAEPGYLGEHNLSKEQLYEKVQSQIALDLTYRKTTRENPASIVFSALSMIAFCTMVALLLKEYVGRRE